MTKWKRLIIGAAVATGVGVALAIAPVAYGQARVERARPRVLDVFAGGSRLGVSIRDVEERDKAAEGGRTGAVVEDVATDSPAEKAGLRDGDIVTEFDGERVRSARQLTRLVQETPPGRTVQAVVLRDGKRTTLSLTPEAGSSFRFEGLEDLADFGRELRYRVAPPPAPPAPPGAPAPPKPPAPWDFGEVLGRSSSRLGITVSPLSPQLAEYFGAKDGVLVSSVRDGSAAAKAGLRAGDVITRVNGTAVNDPADLRRQTQRLEDGAEFTVDVVRDKKPLTLKGTAEAAERRRITRTLL